MSCSVAVLCSERGTARRARGLYRIPCLDERDELAQGHDPSGFAWRAGRDAKVRQDHPRTAVMILQVDADFGPDAHGCGGGGQEHPSNDASVGERACRNTRL